MFDSQYNELEIGDYVSYIEKSYTGRISLKNGIITGFKKYFGKECAIIGNGPVPDRVMQQSIRLISKGLENERPKN